MVVIHASLLAIDEKAPPEYILWPKWSIGESQPFNDSGDLT